MSTEAVLAAIAGSRVIGIIRRRTAAEAANDMQRLISAGVRAIEVSLSTPGAIEVISSGTGTGNEQVHLGIGTVMTAQDVEAAHTAGASFVVSPIGKREIIEAARDLGLASVIGAMTPTECIQAAEYGADLLKLFPASLWPLGSMRGLLKALPQLQLVPTGGISIAEAKVWLDAGAIAVGLGSTLTTITSDTDLRTSLQALARTTSAQ